MDPVNPSFALQEWTRNVTSGNNVIANEDGTPLHPTVRWLNDGNSGYYLVANDVLGIAVGGVNKVLINSDSVTVKDEFKTDTITEYTTDAGVTVEQVLIKDGTIYGNLSGSITGVNLSGEVTSVGAVTTISNNVITDAKISSSANIADTKLATISTAGKVANSATTATASSTASAIVARDSSGNFSANVITADSLTARSTNTNLTLAGNGAGNVVISDANSLKVNSLTNNSGTLAITGTTTLNSTGAATTTIGNTGATTNISTPTITGTTNVNSTGSAVTTIGNSSSTTSALGTVNINASGSGTTTIGNGSAGIGVTGTVTVNSSGSASTSLGNASSTTSLVGTVNINSSGNATTTIGATSAPVNLGGTTTVASGKTLSADTLTATTTNADLTLDGNGSGSVVIDNSSSLKVNSLTNNGSTLTITGNTDMNVTGTGVTTIGNYQTNPSSSETRIKGNVVNINNDASFTVTTNIGNASGATYYRYLR
jgi:hypothetical protein